ncbi:hypothetical protein Tco_0593730 [Tanacetum coccineum]
MEDSSGKNLPLGENGPFYLAFCENVLLYMQPKGPQQKLGNEKFQSPNSTVFKGRPQQNARFIRTDKRNGIMSTKLCLNTYEGVAYFIYQICSRELLIKRHVVEDVNVIWLEEARTMDDLSKYPVPSAMINYRSTLFHQVHICLQTIAPDAPLTKCFFDNIPDQSSSSNHHEIAENHSHDDTPINLDVFILHISLLHGDPRCGQRFLWITSVGNPSQSVSTRKQLASDALCLQMDVITDFSDISGLQSEDSLITKGVSYDTLSKFLLATFAEIWKSAVATSFSKSRRHLYYTKRKYALETLKKYGDGVLSVTLSYNNGGLD